MKGFWISLFFLVFLGGNIIAQNSLGNVQLDERFLYAQTKQVNQFFRRFNAEEDAQGKRLPGNDSLYRNPELRKRYLPFLFDLQTIDTSGIVFHKFMDKIAQKHVFFLNFHKDEWYAEAICRFVRAEEFEYISLYLKLEPDRKGYKWVLSGASSARWLKAFARMDDTLQQKKYFLHPLSHEIDFMNLDKAFRDPKNAAFYTENGFQPDFLSIFLYEMAQGKLRLVNVDEVKFHFMQVPGWYFELSLFNRNSMNSGWLISNLLPLTHQDKAVLRKAFANE